MSFPFVCPVNGWSSDRPPRLEGAQVDNWQPPRTKVNYSRPMANLPAFGESGKLELLATSELVETAIPTAASPPPEPPRRDPPTSLTCTASGYSLHWSELKAVRSREAVRCRESSASLHGQNASRQTYRKKPRRGPRPETK